MYENELKEERKSKRIYYGAIIITFVIMLSITVTYAWFASQVGNNPNLVTVGTLQIEYNQGSYINANNLKPATTSQVLEAYTDGSCVYKGDREQGYTNEKICAYNTFTITNTGTLYAKTDISIKNVVNTYSSNIKYMFNGSKSKIGYARDEETVAKFSDKSVTNIPSTLKFSVKK